MKWIRLDNDLIKLTRLANVLAANGFNVELQFNNLILQVPSNYNIDEFVKRLPITNQFLLQDRKLSIRL